MFTRLIGCDPSESLIQDLDGHSHVLDETLHRFSLMANEDWMRLQIRCFFELRKTSVIGYSDSRAWIPKWQRMFV